MSLLMSKQLTAVRVMFGLAAEQFSAVSAADHVSAHHLNGAADHVMSDDVSADEADDDDDDSASKAAAAPESPKQQLPTAVVRMRKEELHQALDDFFNNGTYMYDTVVWFLS